MAASLALGRRTTTFYAPVANGINRHDIVGTYFDITGRHGFKLSGGHYTTIDVPAAAGKDTQAVGINDAGEIVGMYGDLAAPHGFLLIAGIFAGLDACYDMRGHGISNAGIIVGSYWDDSPQGGHRLTGVSYDPRSSSGCGTYLLPGNTSAHPRAIEAELYGINNGGRAVGDYQEPMDPTFHAVEIDTYPPHPNPVLLDYPNAQQTWARGINDANQVVGYYQMFAPSWHHGGFLFYWGGIVPIDYPGAASTEVHGINNLGPVAGRFQIVGMYTDTKRKQHGFLAGVTTTGGSKQQ